jgi:hypothetical protein
MSAKSNSQLLGYGLALAPLLLAGCSHAPSVDILGSFFPAWLVCFVAAVLLAVLCRFVLGRFQMKVELPVLGYVSLTACLTFALWLIFFH